jgi:predicted RNase H-like HicB family nuclease
MNLTDKEWNPIAQIIRQWECDHRTPFIAIMDAINAELVKRDKAQPFAIFSAVFTDGDDGFIVAECPELPGCMSQGRTREETERNIREAIESVLTVKSFQPVADAQPVDEDMVDQMLVCIYGPKCGGWDQELRRRMAEAARIPLDRMRGPGTIIEQQEWDSGKSWMYSSEKFIDRRIDRILRSKKQTRVEEVTEVIDAYRGGVASELAEKIIARLERYDDNAD